jgi:hypothetical protein
MERALRGHTEFSQSDAIAVLLMTWNRRFYVQRQRPFDEQDYKQLDVLLTQHAELLDQFRRRSIESFNSDDDARIVELFDSFKAVVGATGVAKALHIRAPRFFPLWDSIIAPKAYGLYQRNAASYIRLIQMTQRQIEEAGGESAFSLNPVKAIDEWNYCRFTLKTSFEDA